MENCKCRAKVVVVGAGAAGIAAATVLYKNHFHVDVFESTERIGGRIHTHRTEEGWVELGAQWVHGQEQWLYDYAAAHGILGQSIVMAEASAALREGGAQISANEFTNLTDNTNIFGDKLSKEELQKVDPLESVGAFLKNIYENHGQALSDKDKRELEAAYDWFVRVTKMDAGSDTLHDVNVKNYIDETCVGNYNHQLSVPFADLFNHIRNVPREGPQLPLDRIHLNTTVESLEFLKEVNKIQVTTNKGDNILADHVIVTVPLGVLKARRDTLFRTPLPDRTRMAIETLGYGTVGKVVCFYEEPFWKEWKFDFVQGDVKAFSLFWDGDLENFETDPEKRYINKPWFRAIRSFVVAQFCPNVLVAFLAGSHAATMEKLSDEEVSRDITSLLEKFTSTTVPMPKRVVRSGWSSDKNFNGTYSYLSQSARKAGISAVDLGQPAWEYDRVLEGRNTKVPGLMFAGEATHPKYFSMVHGALLSGWREADRLIQIYGSGLVKKEQQNWFYGG